MDPTEALNKFFIGLTHPPRLVTGVPAPRPVRYSRDGGDQVVYLSEQVARRQVTDRILWGSDIQAYADTVLAMGWPQWYRSDWAVTIRIDQQARTALYRSGVITVPSPVRELVILHEIAHHFTPAYTGEHGSRMAEHHGPLFVQASLDLIEHVLSAAAAKEFRDSFQAAGVMP